MRELPKKCAPTLDSSLTCSIHFRNLSRILHIKNQSKLFSHPILPILANWIYLFNPLITFYFVLDYIYCGLKKLLKKTNIVDLSLNLSSYLDSTDKRILFQIDNQNFLQDIKLFDYDILVGIFIDNLKDTSLIGFLKTITDNKSPIDVHLCYKMKDRSICRTYKFRKFPSVRMTRNFLLSNLQELIIGDLESIQQGETRNISDSCSFETSSLNRSISTGVSARRLFSLLYRSYVSKAIPFTKTPSLETEWCVLLSNGSGEWHHVPNPVNRYLADPHIFQDGLDIYLLVEDFDREKNKGRISMFNILEFDSINELGIVLERDEHISFPQTFAHNNSVWMTVECFYGGGVPVYQFNSLLKSWDFFTTIMPERNFVDPLVFPYDDFWILIATEKSEFGDDFYSKLVIYYSHEPFQNNWKTFTNRVLAFDCSIGRNAGLVRKNNCLIRVAQGHSDGIYGKSISFQNIDSVSDKAYSESPIQLNFPLLPSILNRCHSYSQVQNIIAVDAKFRTK